MAFDPLIPVLLVFGLTALGAFALANPASPLYRLDIPGNRSLHDEATPRGGGLAVVVVVGLTVLISAVFGMLSSSWWPLVLGALLVALISYIDDWRGLSQAVRLAVHLVAATLLVAFADVPNGIVAPGISWDVPAWLLFVPVALLVVWMTNLFNFMDGMDGFAGGMGVIGFGTLALLGYNSMEPAYAFVAVVIAASCGGFLVSNFPPARIFLGDVGSVTLGYLAAGMILLGEELGVLDWWLGVMAFGPFVADSTVTLLRRASKGERVWEPHRSHFYQRIVQLGWSHRRTTLIEYSLMVFSAGAALVAQHASTLVSWLLVLLVIVIYVVLMLVVTFAERSRKSA